MTVAPLARGLWGVLATPFRGPDLDLDLESLRREVDLYLDVPADGLVVLGVFGEGAALDSREQARTAASAARRPLTGVMVQANTADPCVLARHLRSVHDATGAGIVLQDYPGSSGVRIGSERVLEVLAACPFAVAVKSEAPPTAAAIGELTVHTDVPVFGGLGGVGLLDELAAGAAGAMTGFSYPSGLRSALDAWTGGGYAAARAAYAPWLPLVNYEAQPGVGLALRKEILRRRGVFSDSSVRPPHRPAPPALMRLMDDHLAAADQLTAGSRTPPGGR